MGFVNGGCCATLLVKFVRCREQNEYNDDISSTNELVRWSCEVERRILCSMRLLDWGSDTSIAIVLAS